MYIGTSGSELLHFVSLPGEAQDGPQTTTFILASRLQPSSPPASSQRTKGVQQILLLPSVSKACILCNGLPTFYSLPELSPEFGNTKMPICSWVGGRDLDAKDAGEIFMLCNNKKIRLVGINGSPRLVKDIEFPGCLASARRNKFACVADVHSYALLDLENQQKIPLFPISSVDEGASSVADGSAEDASSNSGSQVGRSAPLAQSRSNTPGNPNGHSRSTSLGKIANALGNNKEPHSRSRSRERTVMNNPELVVRGPSPIPPSSPVRPFLNTGSPERKAMISDKALPLPPANPTSQRKLPRPVQASALLRPHIISPVSSEFLLITGTLPDEPGVGIFVNFDGDVVRGTLEFTRYPHAVIVDGPSPSKSNDPQPPESDRDGYVLASITRSEDIDDKDGVEIQRWDGNADNGREWLNVPYTLTSEESGTRETLHGSARVGLALSETATMFPFSEVGETLRAQRLRVYPEDELKAASQRNQWEASRIEQENEFVSRLGQESSSVLVWRGSSIYWAVRNPQILRLDAAIQAVLTASQDTSQLDIKRLMFIMQNIRAREAKTETEFLSFEYIRQKLSLLLFANLITSQTKFDGRLSEEQLLEGNMDPRVILSMIPLLRSDIVEGPNGIWIHAGLVTLLETLRSGAIKSLSLAPDPLAPGKPELLNLIKRFLMVWRQRKGYGSIADETEVFSTVDAALLHILLDQDRAILKDGGNVQTASVRVELYAVVDPGVDCFERAVELLEQYRRLYVLSRLYQSRRMVGKVLATWRRIIDGELDEGGDFKDGETEVRKYLARRGDLTLVEEYGTWLAKRNPLLGVQVFTDDNSKVKLPPNQVVQLLKLQAPDAVKVYLEHLVFGKKNVAYANDLISYYLDNVLSVLRSSNDARSILSQSYESYRALHPPKPTYRQFIIDNSIPAPWWHDRLRLLELLGGTHSTGFSYDVPSILERIEPFEQYLVPESIILDGRQGRHQQALRLLTHGLGDYHTAITYCLLGGSSIFHPVSGSVNTGTNTLLPSDDERARCFKYLFSEFLIIEDVSDRLERTSELLARFGTWFDVADVLGQIPDDWSVELLEAFLASAFRRLVQEKNEMMVTKALSGAQNLKISAELIEKVEEEGPKVEGI